MIILTIKTDKPLAEIGLFEDGKQLAYETWPAHRELSETIHKKIENLLKSHSKGGQDLQGIVCYKGPGSFTGLRIGLAVGNALAYGLGVPIVSQNGKDWVKRAVVRIVHGENEQIVSPEYGSLAKVTMPKNKHQQLT